MTRFSRRQSFVMLGSLLALTACGESWQTSYTPIPDLASQFRLAAVAVAVPDTLTVSEDESVFVPNADILWVEDPPGDRRAQVAAIFKEGVTAGAKGLHGKTPVRIEVTVISFHALNMKARYRAPEGTGVYNISFMARIVDARTGKELVPAQRIDADEPGATGRAALKEEAEGRTQRMDNVDQIARTIAGWLGLGPDNRTDFNRIGG